MRNWIEAVKLLLVACFGLSSLALAIPAVAEGMRVSVSATVLKRAWMQVLSQPTSVVVTAADIARGYVDAPVPYRMHVRTNSLDGYAVDLSSDGEFAKQIVVRGLQTDVQLSPRGGQVSQPSLGHQLTNANLELGFRFVLAEGAREGAYPWPMRVSVVPL